MDLFSDFFYWIGGIYLFAILFFVLRAWINNENCVCNGDKEMHEIYCKHYCKCNRCLNQRKSEK